MGITVIFEDGNINSFEHEMTINILLSTAQEESRAKSTAVQFGIGILKPTNSRAIAGSKRNV